MSSKYSYNSNYSPFSEINDDDMTRDFMNSSSANYLAADRLGEANSETQKRDELLQQVKQVEERTLGSSRRCIGAIEESEKIGIETALDLSKQREQLRNTENRLDDISNTLKDSQKNINGIKSVFTSLRQWWSAPKPNQDKNDESKPVPASSSSGPSMNKNLSSAVEDSNLSLQFSQQSSHPALRLRGVEEDNRSLPSGVQAHSKKVNELLDQDLETMSMGLSRLKQLSKGLGTEIEEHNTMLDRIQDKADKTDLKISSQNTQINRILKK